MIIKIADKIMVGYPPIKSLQKNSRFIYFLFREDGFVSGAFNAHIIKMGCPLNKKDRVFHKRYSRGPQKC